MYAQVYVTHRNGGVSCHFAADQVEMGRRLEAAHRRRLEAVAWSACPERRKLGEVERTLEGRWIYWYEFDAP